MYRLLNRLSLFGFIAIFTVLISCEKGQVHYLFSNHPSPAENNNLISNSFLDYGNIGYSELYDVEIVNSTEYYLIGYQSEDMATFIGTEEEMHSILEDDFSQYYLAKFVNGGIEWKQNPGYLLRDICPFSDLLLVCGCNTLGNASVVVYDQNGNTVTAFNNAYGNYSSTYTKVSLIQSNANYSSFLLTGFFQNKSNVNDFTPILNKLVYYHQSGDIHLINDISLTNKSQAVVFDHTFDINDTNIIYLSFEYPQITPPKAGMVKTRLVGNQLLFDWDNDLVWGTLQTYGFHFGKRVFLYNNQLISVVNVYNWWLDAYRIKVGNLSTAGNDNWSFIYEGEHDSVYYISEEATIYNGKLLIAGSVIHEFENEHTGNTLHRGNAIIMVIDITSGQHEHTFTFGPSTSSYFHAWFEAIDEDSGNIVCVGNAFVNSANLDDCLAWLVAFDGNILIP